MSAENPELQSATALKLSTAKQKKDAADQAFKEGNVKAGEWDWLLSLAHSNRLLFPALMSYHEVTIRISPY